MTSTVILSSLLVALSFLELHRMPAEARNFNVLDARPPTPASSTSAAPPAAYIEDPTNSATSESSEDMCLRCYDQVKQAQSSLAILENLARQQKNHIRQKTNNNKLLSPSAPFQPSSTPSSSRRPKLANQVAAPAQQTTRNNNTHSNPSALQPAYSNPISDQPSRPIVVSTLRVARSPASNGNSRFYGGSEHFAAPTNSEQQQQHQHTRSISVDPTLKQLKHKQQQQVNETCKSLHEVQQCLDEIAQECLGNLQFHSLEVFSKQWLTKINCPPSNDPSFKPFGELIRSIPRIEEREKVPVPRPISSQEETRKRLDAMLVASKTMSPPLGVMLIKPTTATKPSHYHDHQQNLLPSPPTTSQLLMIPCCLLIMLALITMVRFTMKPPTKLSSTSTTTCNI